ncbi:GSCOCG00012904001-RA-CDS, partial [Cotesia congregata]
MGSPNYHSEEERFNSYQRWPDPTVSPRQLAAAGFYYIGDGSNIRCFCCALTLGLLDAGRDPRIEHQRWRPTCRFIQNLPCGNIPRAAPEGVFEIGHQAPATDVDSISIQLDQVNLNRPAGPTYKNYVSYAARLETFKDWPLSMAQTEEEMADAGLFYSGRSDRVNCFHCGGGLREWTPEDDPWEQHARWYSSCHYVWAVKGQAYIE